MPVSRILASVGESWARAAGASSSPMPRPTASAGAKLIRSTPDSTGRPRGQPPRRAGAHATIARPGGVLPAPSLERRDRVEQFPFGQRLDQVVARALAQAPDPVHFAAA